MSFFKVTFGRWIDLSEPAFDNSYEAVKKWAEGKEKFYVEQPNLEAAREYARSFQGLETRAYEGLGELEEIKEIAEAEAKEYLANLSVYEVYRRKRRG